MKLAAYAHTLQEMRDLSKKGFRYVALHSMLFPSIEGGVLPNEEHVADIRRSLKENSLEPVDLVTFNAWYYLGLSGMMEQLPSGPRDPEYEKIRIRGVGQFEKIAKLAADFGCEQVFTLMGGRRVYHYDHEEAWRKSVSDLEPALERYGVKIGFIPHPGDFMEESNPCVDLIKSTGCRQIGYIYVIPHTFVLAGRMDADPAAMIGYASKAGVLNEVHMADSLKPAQVWVRDHYDLQPYHSHLLPGRGSVDIRGALRELVRDGFDGPVLMIPYRYGVSDASFADLSGEAKDTVEKMLHEIGQDARRRGPDAPKKGRGRKEASVRGLGARGVG